MILLYYIRHSVKVLRESYEQLKLWKDSQKFKTKKMFLSLRYNQIKLFVSSISSSDYWDGGMFPTFKDKDRNKTPNAPDKKAVKPKVNKRGYPSINLSLWYNKLVSIRPYTLPSYLWTQLITFKDWSLDVFKRSTGEAVAYLKALL